MDSETRHPAERDAELGMLYILLTQENRWNDTIAEGFSAEHFACADTRDIWNLCAHRKAKGRPLGMVEIKTSIRNNKPEHATPATLSDITEAGFSNPSWSALVGIMQDRLARRIARDAAHRAAEANGPECIQILQNAVRMAAEALTTESALKPARDVAREFAASLIEGRDGADKVGTGIAALDVRTGGIRRGGVWVFGGLPGRGKSVLLFQIAESAIWRGLNVVVFSLELMAEEVASRILTAHGAATADQMQGIEPLTKVAVSRITTACNELAEKRLHVCDRGGLTIDEIEAYATRLHEKDPLDLVLIDYVQLCETAYIKGQNREQQVAQVSRRMKAMAKRLRCGVVTASQLNDDGKMRESRAIKQDADAVFLIKLEGGTDNKPGLLIDKLRGANPHPPFINMTLNGTKQRFE